MKGMLNMIWILTKEVVWLPMLDGQTKMVFRNQSMQEKLMLIK